jgi:integral membrane sensor domain MASE1
MKRLLLLILANVLLAGSYYATARAGLMLAKVNPSASVVWPATGLALAAMLLSRCRVWPGLWLGAFAANFQILHTDPDLTWSQQAWTGAGIASGNTLESLIAVVLIQQFAGGERVYERSAACCATSSTPPSSAAPSARRSASACSRSPSGWRLADYGRRG